MEKEKQEVTFSSVSQGKMVVYGGSFDPPTFGHIEVIEKATKMFERVVVIVAPNYDKPNSMFTPQERAEMIFMSIAGIPNFRKVDVCILPPEEYLASCAKRLGASAMIRGIRDSFDFNAEQKIGETNKKIEPELETIYIMPSSDMAVVSSSWVKSLMGFNGWKKTLEGCVHPFVIRKLEFNLLKRKIKDIFDASVARGILKNVDFNNIWEKLVISYGNRHYHNLSHIGDMLSNLTTMVCNNNTFYGVFPMMPNHPHNLIMRLAIIFHDFGATEEESASIPLKDGLISFISSSDEKMFTELIMATKHNGNGILACPYAIIADLDLFVLARDTKDYFEYVSEIRNEYRKYSNEEFAKGRSDFLKSMIDKPRIFHTNYFEDQYGRKAIDNLRMELGRYGE